ncbi:hypothetical protein [Kitasatospora sp. NPDC058046]|uniref:hypothetical protein n=1 Tax=Kitasatospora sp. NPDC058046 TaxID=3346312 RepID=UPI0036D8BE7B
MKLLQRVVILSAFAAMATTLAVVSASSAPRAGHSMAAGDEITWPVLGDEITWP